MDIDDAPSIAGVDRKLQRAHQHFDELRSAVDHFMQTDFYTLVAPKQDRKGRLPIAVELIEPIPYLDWGVIVGDFVHNLRSALDQLIFQLSLPATFPDLPSGTSFPIFNSGVRFGERQRNGQFTRRSGRYATRLLPPKVSATVESLQPYHRRNNPDSRYLWMLHQLSNVDKHRIVAVSTASIASVVVRVSTSGETSVRRIATPQWPVRFEDRAVIARIEMGYSEVGATMNVDPTTRIGFSVDFAKRGEAEPVRGLPLLSTLGNIGSYVEDVVVAHFRPYFK